MKHQFEVAAECQFYGVEYDFDVRKRFDEIELELKSIGEWFNKKTRLNSVLNAELAIVSRLVTIFRRHNQFDEEQACLVKVRELYRRIWVRKKHGAWLLWPLWFYMEFLLKSWRSFAAAMVLWLVLLTALFAWNGPEVASAEPFLAFRDALHTFFGGEPPKGWDADFGESAPSGWYLLATTLAVVGGFVHLGVFVSHLYSIIARK